MGTFLVNLAPLDLEAAWEPLPPLDLWLALPVLVPWWAPPWLACCAFERSEALVSVCRSGFVNVWDPMDGRCLSSSSSPMLSGATVGAAAMLPRLG